MNTKQFDNWLVNSQPGDKAAYYQGWLAKDGQVKWPEGVIAARKAFNEGFVELVAERVSGGYTYWAQRKAKREKPSEDLRFSAYWIK